VFASTRGFDMIRQSVCYNRANVKIVAHAAGQSMGYTGPSHHTVEDISAIRALPYMAILSPCDGVEVKQLVQAMAEHEGPVYLRLSRVAVPHLHGDDYRFRLGKLDRLAEGSDVTFFATGDLVHLALEARMFLAGQGVGARVVNVPCLKPLEGEEVVAQGADTLGAVTIEDHNVQGGLGSIISEIYSGSICKPVLRVGIPDMFTESDDCEKLRKKAGISIESVEKCVHLIIERRQAGHG
jgi:transketolase